MFVQFIVSSEDELVSLDDLQEKIAEFDDYVQSTDIAAMQSMADMYPVVVALTDVCRALDWEICGEAVVCTLVGKGVERVTVYLYLMTLNCSRMMGGILLPEAVHVELCTVT